MSDHDSGYNAGNYNKTGFLAFLGSFGFSIIFFIVLGYGGYSDITIDDIKDLPPEGVAGVKSFDLSSVEKPWVSSDEMIAHGKKVYLNNCKSCHGVSGKGDGPGSAGMNVRNLIEGNWKQGGSSIALYKTLANGVAGTSMAAFGHIKPASRWGLVHFVRSITQNKVEDDAAELEAFAKEQ